MFGFYNTSHLIDDMKEEDLTQMGMRTLQRRKLLRKIEALKTGMMSEIDVFEETEKEIEINSQPKKKNWKRRFSVASNMEYFENLESGKTQWSAPEAFGGVDETEKTDATAINLENPLTKEQNLKTTADKLQEAKLNTYINQIENVFDNDLNAITHEWMNANMKTIHIRRLKTLIARENGCLWYSGTTADYNWWMNATNDEVLYFPPTGTTDVVLPVPKTYFDEDSAKKAKDQTPVTRGKKNWRIASAKMRTMNAFSKKYKIKTDIEMNSVAGDRQFDIPLPPGVVLPAGWKLAKDPVSDKTYYFNREQDLTSWTVPTATTETKTI